MVRFKYFVRCSGWVDGGYENAAFAPSKKEAERHIKEWNERFSKSGSEARVELISVEEISDREFARDYIC